MEVPPVMLNHIKATSTATLGWYNQDLMTTWKKIFPLTKESQRLGSLPFSNPAWQGWPNPWWEFLTESSSTKSGEDLSVANTTFNFGRISLVQIESFRRDSQAPNASGSTDYGVLSGQQSNQEIDLSIPSKFAVQSHGFSEGDAHGSYGAHNNSD